MAIPHISITKTIVTPEQANEMMQIQIRCLDSEVYMSTYSTAIVECWKSTLTREEYINWSYTDLCYVAEEVVDEERRIVAYGYLESNPTHIPKEYECHLRIHGLYVEPKYHRKGIGKKLMEELENEARRQKCAKIGIRSTMPAVLFYEAVGYMDVGKVWYDGYKAGRIELRLMIKEL